MTEKINTYTLSFEEIANNQKDYDSAANEIQETVDSEIRGYISDHVYDGIRYMDEEKAKNHVEHIKRQLGRLAEG